MVSVRRTGRPPPFAAERLITSAATASWAAASIIVTVSYKSDKQVSESRVADGRTDGRRHRGREDGRQTARHTATTAAAAGGGLGRTSADGGTERSKVRLEIVSALRTPSLSISHATPYSIQMNTFWE